ncbi:uncharacterized protein LOC118234051 [Anguilla anguilla]|uniref:uncharacterized protein LOC118234051 n=1 Tax=Anguilla anguilla TaxID=7936 RepID=UPI0015AE643B|nr:uncharacterized protein LOC118234051 [Anguilla anguilla]
MEQIKETAKLRASQVKGGGTQFLEQINKAMAVYGIVAGFIGAGKFFAENDTVRGAFTLTQSLHGGGDMAGLNQQLSKMSQKIFQEGLHKATEALGVEKSFAAMSSSVERFGESAAGLFLKNIPIIGLAFQSYFIAEDSIAIQKHNGSDPEQNKYLGLKITNLVLDVSTTVLTLAEVAFPPAAIVLGPLTIGLTVARMSIGDFYCDVVSELDQLPKGAGDFDKMTAVMVGLKEGAVDFVTGGLLRELKGLEKEQRQNKELLHNLATPESYFKITANNSTLDLTKGILSQYAGFVTVWLSNDGNIKIQIGGVPDGNGGVKTIEVVKHYPDIQSIALAFGESSQVLYTEKAAHLLWIIPVSYEKVFCGEIKLHSSLFGSYYGNDQANQFFAPQLPTKKQSSTSTDPCAYGGLDLEFVIKNYHYNIYGHGGDDTFFLGPQTSKLSGGEGRDFYIFPTAGSYAEIDNFAHDSLEDHLLIKAPFSHIDCVRKNTDLFLVYGPQRYTVTVRDWFAHSNTDHYQHMIFQSADGVMFKVADMGLLGHKFHANCVPESLDKTRSQSPVSVRLAGDFKSVITVLGSNYSDSIVGNEKDNVFNGGPGADMLEGGEGADTYEIFQGQGCDKVNNYAKDQKVDLVVLHVPFRRIRADLRGEDLLVFDMEDMDSTCILLTKWHASSLFQHVAFLSADHVTFHVSSNDTDLAITALIVDLSKDTHGGNVNLSESNQLLNVISVFDSTHDDVVYGNAHGNFLSCSGGVDILRGADGSDKYVVKSGCKSAYIANYAQDQASDVLFLEHPFENLRVRYQSSDLVLTVEDSDIKVHLQNWLMGKQFQHLVLQTIDGVISMLPLNVSEPEVLTPFEITLSQENCTDYKKKFDFSKDPFTKVERFKAKSNKCSYSVIGNNMNNYIDPGIGNPMNYQYLKGGNGSDTYVFGHKYGYGNEIDNEAKDMKRDYLFFQVLYKDIVVLLEHPHVILFSRSRNDSVRVHLLKYLHGPEQQHLLIRSADGVSFSVNPNSYPYKSVVSIDASTSTKSCNISCAEGEEYLRVSQIYGTTGFSNYITGSRSSSLIIGGNMADYLLGNEGSERIEGHGGNDIINGQSGDDNLLGGKGDDVISGGAGNDMIYGGWGADKIDGGPGVDVVFFSGDVRTSTGVKVDLSSGRGEWADAENDTYTAVEDVSGTNFNDLIIGDEEDNELVGKFGNDTLVPGHGSDVLFGGPGNDLYVLDDCSGVKHINNFASDMALDYILLRDFNANDACFFLQEGTLIISFSHHDPVLSLIQRDSLTVVLYNWSNNDSFYQHVDLVFAQNSLITSAFFSSAEEISPSLLEINSMRPTLYTRQANETAVEIEIKVPNAGESSWYTRNSKFKYHLKVSDQLFFSDSLQWTNQPLIKHSGLLSGVLYTFQFFVMLCEVPVLVLAETTHLTNPNPPTSVHLTNVTDWSTVIIWERPSSDSDPNSEQYTYVVEVQSLADGHTMQFMTNYTKLEITPLNPASHYKVSVSSAIKEVKSLKSTIRLMETTNLCPNFIAPEGTRVVDEKMTRHGPVVVIECRQGYRSTSSLEIPCLGDMALRPCVPKSCAHQGEVFDHGEIIREECFDLRLVSRCRFGDLIPPIVTCCHPIPQIANGSPKYSYRQHPVSIAAEYDCNTGYDLSGPRQFDCNPQTGQWSSPFPLLPSCIPITCLAPPKVDHGKLLVIHGHPGQYKKGDVLRLVCDDLYRPSSVDLITCPIGKWTLIPSCVPSVQLVNVTSTDSRLHGLLQKWDSGSWSSEITTMELKHLAEFSCEERGLKFRNHTVSWYHRNVKVECTKLKLETFRGDYIGRPEGNYENGGWKKICIEDKTAAQAFCRKLFPDQTGWTTRVLWDSGFHSGYTYRCDGGCRFETESRMCYRQIQCRATCDPLSVPNGQVSCDSEGEWCNVHCNRLYRLDGDDTVQCRSDGWSRAPYCIGKQSCTLQYLHIFK